MGPEEQAVRFLWFVVFILLLVCAGWWAITRARRQPHALGGAIRFRDLQRGRPYRIVKEVLVIPLEDAVVQFLVVEDLVEHRLLFVQRVLDKEHIEGINCMIERCFVLSEVRGKLDVRKASV